ncbi:MAG: MFS transporter [Pseudomonadota bacterium]
MTEPTEAAPVRPRQTLLACCGAHLTQDGLVALQYVVLPILAQTFSLSYAQVGLLRAVSHTSMSLLELPAGLLAERVGERRLLVAGLLGAGGGYLIVAHAIGFWWVVLGFFVAGAGAALQHSLASSVLVQRFPGSARRKALGTYNSAGDAGKLAFTAAFSAAVGAGFVWDAVVTALAIGAVVFAALLHWLLRPAHATDARTDEGPSGASARSPGWGISDRTRFSALGTMVFFDSAVQAVFLTFLAFIMQAKGAGQGVAAAAVVLALIGGMIGKFTCGYLAARLGDRVTFILVQVLTALGLIMLAALNAEQALIALPLLGLVVQGSTTVSYGSVADFVEPGFQARGYAIIYTLSSASSVAGPMALGWVADQFGLNLVLYVVAAIAAGTLLVARILPGRIGKQATAQT